jgi:hypothetical protein
MRPYDINCFGEAIFAIGLVGIFYYDWKIGACLVLCWMGKKLMEVK